MRPQPRYTAIVDTLLAQDDSDDAKDDMDEDGIFIQDYPNAPMGTQKPVADDLHKVFQKALQQKVIPTKANLPAHISYHGISYATSDRHEGNSCILFRASDIPYSIRNIVQFPASEDTNTLQGVWVVVQRHIPAKLESDPYQEYPELGARIWHEDYKLGLEVQSISEVDADFAKCPLPQWDTDDRVVVVVSLRHVSGILCILFHQYNNLV